MQTNADNNRGGFNDVRDKVVEQTAKLLGNITHSSSRFASTEQNELPANSTERSSGAMAGNLII
jgi:hypothetical protein